MFNWFKKVIYTCRACGIEQRIPLRRVHFFERIQRLENGEAVLIQCPSCYAGLQIPTPYRTHTGHLVEVDPEKLPREAFIHGVLPGLP